METTVSLSVNVQARLCAGLFLCRQGLAEFYAAYIARSSTMPYYLAPKQDDFNQIPEMQVCIAEALDDVDSVLVV